MTPEKAKELGLTPMARILGGNSAGVDPRLMGIGPVPATRNLLNRLGKSIEDIGLVELNEAFAVQSLAVIRELGLDQDRVNVNGGAIALGHPLGCSGARILTTLLHEMEKRDTALGLATLCVGVGQGVSVVVERDA
jgi:acetyl-CoA acetyltransferase family protein